MAVTLLRVLVLGVIAAAADDVAVTWSSASRAALQCSLPDAGRATPRRPPPPLDADDRARAKPFIWRRDGREFRRVPWNGTLEMSQRKEDLSEGIYQCAVKHHGGLILGYPLQLKFAYFDKQFKTHPKNTTAQLGQPFLLSCEIGSGPPAVITWQRNNEPLQPNSRYYVLKNQLFITELTKEDIGAYRCKATNTFLNKFRYSPAGSLKVEDDTGDVEITLLHIETENPLYVSRGSRVEFLCPVTGWPKPKLVWEHMSREGNVNELKTVDEILVLRAIDYDQEGVYTCTVEGNSDLVKTFNVTITEPLMITVPPASKQSLLASTVRFNCTAVGRPTPKITWYKDGQPLDYAGQIALVSSAGGKREELLIRSVTSRDSGVYQCMARSGPKLVSAWASLEVRGLEAQAPSNAVCQPVAAKTVRVRWSCPTENVVAYTVHSAKPGDTSFPNQPINESVADIAVQYPLVPYEFKVQAFVLEPMSNKTIPSEFSKKIICSGQGVPVKLDKLGDDAILVSWKTFYEQNPGVVQWILQYKAENSTEEKNVTLDGSVFNYTIDVPTDKAVLVRLLGSRSLDWLQQNLTLVPWTSTKAASHYDGSPARAVPEELEVTEVGPRSFRLRWRCSEADLFPDRYTYLVCTKMSDGTENCIESYGTSATVSNLQPNTEYSVRVQARLPDRQPAGDFSPPYEVVTQPEGPKIVQWEGDGVRVWWDGSGSSNNEGAAPTHVVRYSQNLTHSLDLWPAVNVTGNTLLIQGLDPSQLTYVMVTASGPSQRSQVITVPARPPTASLLYVWIGASCGTLVLCLMTFAALCLWRRRKRSRTPVRISRRRRNASHDEGDGEECSEMKDVGGRLANGGRKDAGEPLLNGHVHITENPTSKTPNGKMRKGRVHEAIFDVSRLDEDNLDSGSIVVEIGAEPDTSGLTAYTLLDTSRRPEYEESKLPDGNMNSERREFEAAHGQAQPTLQPNG